MNRPVFALLLVAMVVGRGFCVAPIQVDVRQPIHPNERHATIAPAEPNDASTQIVWKEREKTFSPTSPLAFGVDVSAREPLSPTTLRLYASRHRSPHSRKHLYRLSLIHAPPDDVRALECRQLVVL
ncbi:MAG: hypothetical protein O3A46_09620 [Candidatus Poribacteria bacterium]|nr:hypothetical protein [Candidatus Poribacteria bacterium]